MILLVVKYESKKKSQIRLVLSIKKLLVCRDVRMNSDLDGLLEFLLYVGQAKRTFRTDWILRGVEKVADHMYRMAMMSLLLPTISEESKVRCMKLALVHDLSESVVGDLTEFDSVPKTEKRRRETEAMLYLTSLLPADVGRDIFSLFNEYADQKTNEAKLVKDLDIFDMILQGKYQGFLFFYH